MKLLTEEEWRSISAGGPLPSGSKLIQDRTDLKIIDRKKIFTESRAGKEIPALKLTGIFQRGDIKNTNGRVYATDILEQAVKNISGLVKKRAILGEYDHPSDAKIHLDRVSHLITNLWMEGNVVYGEIEVFNDDSRNRMPRGSQLEYLIERNVQVGISSRGVGDMEITQCEGEEAYRVLPGYSLVTFDVVAEPSVVGTQLKKVTSESINKIVVNKKEVEQLMIEELKRIL